MTAETELAKVQNLYVLQMEVWKVLDGKVRSDNQVKEAQKNLKEFSKLLKQVDWKYMGGEDVYDTLQTMHKDAESKLKQRVTKMKKA